MNADAHLDVADEFLQLARDPKNQSNAKDLIALSSAHSLLSLAMRAKPTPLHIESQLKGSVSP